MKAADLIRRLHAHRRWSNRRLVDAARSIDDSQLHQTFPIGMGSVWATLVHLYAAEHGWLQAIDGDTSGRLATPDDLPAWNNLDPAWKHVEQRWDVLLNELTDSDLDRPITKTRTRPGGEPGQTHTTPLHDVLLHVCTHAQYTGSQCINMLRQLGIASAQLPDIQLITFAREYHNKRR